MTNGAAMDPRPHPAKYSAPIVELLTELLADRDRFPGLIVDPFAGTGRIHDLGRDDTLGVELEPEWSGQHPSTITGNAVELDTLLYDRGVLGQWENVGTICTSPTYGNRMADTYAGEPCPACDGTGDELVDSMLAVGVPGGLYPVGPCPECDGTGRRPSRRHTYRIALGRDLTDGSSAGLQWGPAYRELHLDAWLAAYRALAPDGAFVLNISDHIRGGRRQYVAGWHVSTLVRLGLSVEEWHKVETRRQRHGANADLRVDSEDVIILRKVTA